MLKRTWFVAFLGLAILALHNSTHAASHLWRISEIYSNADGTVQFIELHECCNSSTENALANKKMKSVQTGNIFNIPTNLVGSTLDKYLLFATPAFASLPGAPTPDHIIPANFFAVTGDTIEWEPTLNYDEFTFTGAQLPDDGVNAIHILNWATETFELVPNTPTNFAGVMGSVNAGPPVPAASTWTMTVLALLILVAGTVALRRRSPQLAH